MPGTTARSANETPESVSRSSSITVVSPVVRDSVGEIVDKLGEIDDLIGNLESPTDMGNAPDKKALLREISKLGEEVDKVKLDQASQVKAIQDDVKKNTKNQILESVGATIQSLIADEVAAQTKAKMEEWARKPKAVEFVNDLQGTASGNIVTLGEARITLDNSLSRHANSTLDIQDDFSTNLKIIRRKDGYISEHFPMNLRELFSYDAPRLVELIEGYDLNPLDKHTENLTRFLIFIGVNQTIPDQLVNVSDERPPAYGNADETRDGKNPKGARGGGGLRDTKQDTKSSSWW